MVNDSEQRGEALLNAIRAAFRAVDARFTIFQKVLVASSAIIAAGAAFGYWLTAHYAARSTVGLVVSYLFTGVALTLGLNYTLLVVAFRPLVELRKLMERVEAGDFAARAPEAPGDPDIARLARTTNEMLDRLVAYRRSVSSQILRAQEDERRRIARELHDETSQALTTVMLTLQMARESLGDGQGPAREQLERAAELTARTLEEVKRLTFELRPTILDDLGLVPALRRYTKTVLEPLGLQVTFEALGLDGRLDPELETALFRIVQEALTNVVRHARASRVAIELVAGPGGIRATVADDGIGFEPGDYAGETGGRGLGLVGMRERAELVGGRLVVRSQPGHGTVVEVEVPRAGEVKADAR